MSDTDRDPQMTRYLTQAAVPDHAPEFWDNLDKQLDTIDFGNPKTLPSDLRPVAPIEDRQRDQAMVTRLAERSGPPWRRGAAIAAVAAAILGAISIFVQRNDDPGSVIADDPGVSTTFTPAVADPTKAIEVTERFIHALGEGNIAEARATLGPRSEAYLTSLGSVDGILRESQEGYGSLDGLRNREVWALPTGTNEFVVVVKGESPVENPETRVEAFPVVKAESANSWFVEPWALDPDGESRIQLEAPDPMELPPTMKLGDAVRVSLPQAGSAQFGLDRGELVTLTPDAGSRTVEWVPADVETGEHTLVIVYFNDKIFTALARQIDITP